MMATLIAGIADFENFERELLVADGRDYRLIARELGLSKKHRP
jgi:hypothetical protein